MVPITFITTGILGLLYLLHTVRVISARSADDGPALGDGGSEAMERKIRTHGNFAEYIPFLLFVLFLLETVGVAQGLLIAYAVLLVLGRVIHAYGLLPIGGVLWARIVGMVMTITVLGLGSVGLLVMGLSVL
ncbi:MAG: MAPEG family protein [Candidatus Pacebacteria bacterium]|jgi:hypothetical protein|nr:MAPEG family protein [Candidatus Paceibacterota bacterium]